MTELLYGARNVFYRMYGAALRVSKAGQLSGLKAAASITCSTVFMLL